MLEAAECPLLCGTRNHVLCVRCMLALQSCSVLWSRVAGRHRSSPPGRHPPPPCKQPVEPGGSRAVSSQAQARHRPIATATKSNANSQQGGRGRCWLRFSCSHGALALFEPSPHRSTPPGADCSQRRWEADRIGRCCSSTPPQETAACRRTCRASRRACTALGGGRTSSRPHQHHRYQRH